jgi:Predicted membrane protein (DUF2254)
MHERLSLLLRSAIYALRGGFLIRPLVIALLLGAAGAILSFTEEYFPALNAWIPEVLFPAHQDPQVAQTIFAMIATSIMTVVSIVFAILLMTLTLASTQFLRASSSASPGTAPRSGRLAYSSAHLRIVWRPFQPCGPCRVRPCRSRPS